MDRPVANLAWLARHHFGKMRVASFVACACPALWLLGEWWADSLGVNPLNRMLHFTGRWALIMLTLTLALTSVRRLSVWVSQAAHARYGKRISDWNWLIRLRRQFGLFTFFYACLHLAVYVAFDAGFDIRAIRDDALERLFVLIGMAAFVLLVPLAATSNHAAMRALGKTWRRLQMLSYLVAVLAIAHFWLQAKVGDMQAVPYAVVMAVLLGSRLLAWLRGERGVAGEVKER